MIHRLKSRFCEPEPVSRRPDEGGFTLVELLVVLAIIGLVTAIATPQVLRYLGTARVSTTNAQLSNIGSALELYYLDHGAYPPADAGLSALSRRPAESEFWNGPYIKGDRALQDAWGNPFGYVVIAESGEVVVKSLGRDGVKGGEGQAADIEYKLH